MAIRKITLTDLRTVNREPAHPWNDIIPGDLVRSGKYAFTPFSGIALVLEVNPMTRQATLLLGEGQDVPSKNVYTPPGAYVQISNEFTKNVP